MNPKTGMSQVKFQVRHNALLLREFTVADIVQATGLNPESVRTELQRMRKERLLTSQPSPRKPKKRGGNLAVYRLTDDPEARLALSKSIEAFYPLLPPSNRPTSRYYLRAKKLLDRAQTLENPHRSQLLADAKHDLEVAEQAEGGGLASESVRAYLQYERARLAYWRGERDEAKMQFEALREFFTGVDFEVIAAHIYEYRLCLEVWDRLAEKIPDGVSIIESARCLLDTLDDGNYQTESPLTLFLLRLVHDLWGVATKLDYGDVIEELREFETGLERKFEAGLTDAISFVGMLSTFRQEVRQQQLREQSPASGSLLPDEWGHRAAEESIPPRPSSLKPPPEHD